MTRYFYTDPLAAAWMAKHFGMRFRHVAGGNHCDLSLAYDIRTFAERNPISSKYPIHIDSLHLLTPVVGDICVMSLGGGMVVLEFYDGTEPESLVEILSRDGKRFFWPESEEA